MTKTKRSLSNENFRSLCQTEFSAACTQPMLAKAISRHGNGYGCLFPSVIISEMAIALCIRVMRKKGHMIVNCWCSLMEVAEHAFYIVNYRTKGTLGQAKRPESYNLFWPFFASRCGGVKIFGKFAKIRKWADSSKFSECLERNPHRTTPRPTDS